MSPEGDDLIGLFLYELPPGRAGGGVGKAIRFGLKFEAKLFVRLPSSPRTGFLLQRTFLARHPQAPHFLLFCTLQAKPILLGKSLGLHVDHYQWVYLCWKWTEAASGLGRLSPRFPFKCVMK